MKNEKIQVLIQIFYADRYINHGVLKGMFIATKYIWIWMVVQYIIGTE